MSFLVKIRLPRLSDNSCFNSTSLEIEPKSPIIDSYVIDSFVFMETLSGQPLNAHATKECVRDAVMKYSMVRKKLRAYAFMVNKEYTRLALRGFVPEEKLLF